MSDAILARLADIILDISRLIAEVRADRRGCTTTANKTYRQTKGGDRVGKTSKAAPKKKTAAKPAAKKSVKRK